MTVIARRLAPLRDPGPMVAKKRRRLPGGAASARPAGLLLAALAALFLAACGTSAPSNRTTAAPQATVASASSVTPAATASLSAAERLTAALTPLTAGYTFDTMLTVGKQVAAHVSGRRIGDASEFVIDSGGASVTYRMIPPTSWIRQDPAGWVEAEGAVPSGDPLAALLAPESVEGLSAGSGVGGTTELRVTYKPAALGLTGADPIPVTITIGANGAVTARYTAAMGSAEGVSTTTLAPQAAQDPIVPPSLAPDAGQ